MVVRELMPQDLKLEIDQLTRDEAVSVARYLASVVGKAHARQMTSGSGSRNCIEAALSSQMDVAQRGRTHRKSRNRIP